MTGLTWNLGGFILPAKPANRGWKNQTVRCVTVREADTGGSVRRAGAREGIGFGGETERAPFAT